MTASSIIARPPNRSRAADAGFTLIEVMIAVAILGLIGAVTYKAFDGAWDLKQRVEKAEERDQTVRGALNRMSREISMAFLSEHFDRKRFRQRPTLFKLKDGRSDADLTFTSMANERLFTDAKESDQALFEYKLDRDPDDGGKTSLFRRVKTIVDEEPDRGGEKQVLAEDVLKFNVQIWDAKGREWRDEWDSNGSNTQGQVQIPPRVKLTLIIKDENGKEKTYTTQAKIFLGAPLDF